MTAGRVTTEVPKPKRRWLQFSVRSLLVLTLAVSLFFSWLAVETRRARRQREALVTLHAGTWRYDYEFDDSFESIPNPRHPAPQWLRKLTHEDLLTHVVALDAGWGSKITAEALAELEELPRLRRLGCENCVLEPEGLAHLSQLTELRELNLGYSRLDDADLSHLRDLTWLESLRLASNHVGDEGLKHLKQLTRLKELGLSLTDITDEGLVHLQGMTELTSLALIETQITDAGLKHLRPLKKLEALYLGGTQVTDDGLVHLEGFTNLRVLDVRNTRVTQQHLQQFKQLLPNCRFVVSPPPPVESS